MSKPRGRHVSCRAYRETARLRQGVTIVMTSIRALQCLLTMAALSGAASPLNAQTAIRFSLDWKYEGTQSPFLVGVDKGYFKAEGLDVTIDTAGGSGEPTKRPT